MKSNLPSSFESFESSREDDNVALEPMRKQYMIKLFEAIEKISAGWIRFSISLKEI